MQQKKEGIEQNKILVDEILSLYGDKPSFVGWYIPHETGSNIYNIKETMGGLTALCKEKSPDKKVIISPFFRGINLFPEPIDPKRTAREWRNILEFCGKNIDICAFQDGTTKLEDYQDYLREVKTVMDEYGIALWANVETFERDVRCMYYPIPFVMFYVLRADGI